MVSRILTSVSQNEIERTSERTKIGLAGAIKEWKFKLGKVMFSLLIV